LDRGGLIGPRSDGFASRIDRIDALLESESRQKETELQLLRKILAEMSARRTEGHSNPGKPLLLEENRFSRDLRPSGPSDMMRLQIQGVSRIFPSQDIRVVYIQ
jgi:hypothetical protein